MSFFEKKDEKTFVPERRGIRLGLEEQVGDTVRVALQKYWTFFGIAGLALIVFAAGDGFPKFLVQLSAGWQEALFAAGCVFVAACFAVVAIEIRGGTDGHVAKIADFGLEITSPDDGERVTLPVRFAGTLKQPLPPGCELWLFGCAGQLPASYWPQRAARVSGTTWRCDLMQRWTTGSEAPYVIMIVGPDGQALIRLYWELNTKVQEATQHWGGALEQLTADMRPCTEPRLIKWQDLPPAS